MKFKKYECSCGHMFKSETEVDTCPECKKKELTLIETKTVEVKTEPTGSPMEQVKQMMGDINSAVKASADGSATRMDAIEADLKKIGQLQSEVSAERRGGNDVGSDLVRVMLENKGMLSTDRVMQMDNSDPLIKQAQEANDNLYLMGTMFAGHAKGLRIQDTNYFKEVAVNPILKGMFNSSGVGSEWVPTGFSASMIDLVTLDLRIANLFQKETMPTSPYKSPLKTGNAKAYRTTSSGSDAPSKFKASNVSTSDMTYEAELITARVVWDGAWDEDSIIASLPMLRQSIAYAIASAIESAIINGQVSDLTFDATDMHGDDVTTISPESSWDGLRYHAKLIEDGGADGVTDLGGSFATDGSDITNARSNMGKYGLFSKDLTIITGSKGYFKALATLKDIQTLDKYGAQAFILSGEVAKVQGIPVIVSEFEREDLNASGVSAGTSGGTDTAMQVLNSRGFRIGDRRSFTIESNKIQGTDALEIWATMRLDFQRVYATSEAVLHNLVQCTA